jgi:hypothetical protein
MLVEMAMQGARARESTEEALRLHLDATIQARQHAVKHMLAPLATLIADVVVFVDTLEPHHPDRVERIRSFAEQVHA